MTDKPAGNLARYVGQDRNGTARNGVISPGSISDWCEARWRAGWRWAKVTLDDVLVGEVADDYNNPGRRTWWAQSSERG